MRFKPSIRRHVVKSNRTSQKAMVVVRPGDSIPTEITSWKIKTILYAVGLSACIGHIVCRFASCVITRKAWREYTDLALWNFVDSTCIPCVVYYCRYALLNLSFDILVGVLRVLKKLIYCTLFTIWNFNQVKWLPHAIQFKKCNWLDCLGYLLPYQRRIWSLILRIKFLMRKSSCRCLTHLSLLAIPLYCYDSFRALYIIGCWHSTSNLYGDYTGRKAGAFKLERQWILEKRRIFIGGLCLARSTSLFSRLGLWLQGPVIACCRLPSLGMLQVWVFSPVDMFFPE